MDTLYTFWDNMTHYKTESVYFLGLMNSATKNLRVPCQVPLSETRISGLGLKGPGRETVI